MYRKRKTTKVAIQRFCWFAISTVETNGHAFMVVNTAAVFHHCSKIIRCLINSDMGSGCFCRLEQDLLFQPVKSASWLIPVCVTFTKFVKLSTHHSMSRRTYSLHIWAMYCYSISFIKHLKETMSDVLFITCSFISS